MRSVVSLSRCATMDAGDATDPAPVVLPAFAPRPIGVRSGVRRCQTGRRRACVCGAFPRDGLDAACILLVHCSLFFSSSFATESERSGSPCGRPRAAAFYFVGAHAALRAVVGFRVRASPRLFVDGRRLAAESAPCELAATGRRLRAYCPAPPCSALTLRADHVLNIPSPGATQGPARALGPAARALAGPDPAGPWP